MQRYQGVEEIAQVYANWPAHPPVRDALHALETVALRAENSAQMAAQAAAVDAQVAVRAVARIHAVQDALHQ